MTATIYRDYNWDTVYSPDDGGYYCQIYDNKGVEVAMTKIYSGSRWAENEARRLIDAMNSD